MLSRASCNHWALDSMLTNFPQRSANQREDQPAPNSRT
jgi:hypothetical protein